jgi:hypothetical protein
MKSVASSVRTVAVTQIVVSGQLDAGTVRDAASDRDGCRTAVGIAASSGKIPLQPRSSIDR